MDYGKVLDLKDIHYFCDYDLVWKTEEWKEIPDYEGYYHVSDLGRVKSLGNNKTKKEKILKSHYKKGYRYLSLFKNNISNSISVHRLVAISFIINPENKPCVNHKNSIRDCNVLPNLEWCTYQENNIHAFVMGLQKIGVDNGRSKLTDLQVIDIRKSKLTHSKISKIYNVSPGTISAIIKRQTWKHVE